MRKSKPKAAPPKPASSPAELSRDIYGFTVRPQHVEHYKEYVSIYLEEEAERSDRWDEFLARYEEPEAKLLCRDGSHDGSSDSEAPIDAPPTRSAEGGGEASPDAAGETANNDDDRGHADASEGGGVIANWLESPATPPLPYLSRSPSALLLMDGRSSRSFRKGGESEARSLDKSASWSGPRSLWPVERAMQFRVSDRVASSANLRHTASETSLGSTEDTAASMAAPEVAVSVTVNGEAADDESSVASPSPPRAVADRAAHCERDDDHKNEEEGDGNNGDEEEDVSSEVAEARSPLPPPAELESPPVPAAGRELPPVPPAGPESPTVPTAGLEILTTEVTRRRGTSVDFGKVPYDEELKSLVRGGVPMSLRGQLWQIFAGTKQLMVPGHYNALLTLLDNGGGASDGVDGIVPGATNSQNYKKSEQGIQEKWTIQIEKDLPRTFPGHPALDQDGRNALRRLLTAYARHNPIVGYCQGMNFLAALLLLLMPEENAFWTLATIIDSYLEGYYSEQMIEAQVDQLVFDELVQRYFPTVAAHLDGLGVQIAWMSGPWFLSVFVNILPWETVLRVWDVMLFEGNRSMLIRTALALMDMNAPALVATKDAGDSVALLQSMAADTFDSSQLVLTACMGFNGLDQALLESLRDEYRPGVVEKVNERSRELLLAKALSKGKNGVSKTNGNAGHHREDSTASCRSGGEPDGPDFAEQVVWLKSELTRALDGQQSALARERELEAALVELAQEDNRRQLSAEVEALRVQVGKLEALLKEKEMQADSMVEVMVRMQMEQAETERLRIEAEANAAEMERERNQAVQDAAAQRRVAELLQEKYEGLQDKHESVARQLAEMETRATLAESMIEASVLASRSNGDSVSSYSASPKTSPRPSPEPQLPPVSRGWRLSGSLSGSFSGLPLKGRSAT